MLKLNLPDLLNRFFENKWAPYVAIVLFGFFLYIQTFLFGFTYLDDNRLILENNVLLSSFHNLPTVFQTDVFNMSHSASYYRPFLTISFMFDHLFFGISPFMYHFSNVFLHLFAVCLVFIFFKKLKYDEKISYLFSFIFLVHPVLSQAVAWVPGRNDSLLVIFILLSFIFFINYLQKNKIIYFILHVLFYLFALFTKETALFLIFPLLFYFYFFREKEERIFKKIYWLIPWAIIIVFWFFLRNSVIVSSDTNSIPFMLKSVFVNMPGALQLLGKIVFPFNLSVLPIIQNTTFIYGVLAFILVVLMLFKTSDKKWTNILFGVFWFCVFLFPSFIRPNPDLVADFIEHRLYLPIIGFMIILMETSFIKKIDFKRNLHIVFIFILIIFFSTITLLHSRNFSNRLSFWENAAKNSPDYPLARRNLGAMYYLDDKIDEAEAEFKEALLLNPNEPMVHNNLGLIYEKRNMSKESEAEYFKELEINPYYENAYANLGLLYFKEKKFDKAEESWKKALSINPGFLNVVYYMLVMYAENGRIDEARWYAKKINEAGYPVPTEFLNLLK